MPLPLAERRLPDIATAVRFVGVGVVNTLAYAAVSLVASSAFGAGPQTANLIGFVAALPLAYLAHRRVTFRSSGQVGAELFRFTATNAASFAVSVVATWIATRVFGLHPAIAVAAVCVLVPLANLLVMDRWVFGRPHRSA